MIETLKAVLFVAAIMLSSGGGLMLLWYAYRWLTKPRPPAPSPAILALDPAGFIALLREENPESVGIHDVDAFGNDHHFRFTFLSSRTEPTIYETRVRPFRSGPWCSPQTADLERLYEHANWENFCSDSCACGNMGVCIHTQDHPGWINDPLAIIGKTAAPAPDAVKPFMPPKGKS